MGRASTGLGQGNGVSASPTQERENETETDIEQRLAAQEEELRAMVESRVTVLGEVRDLSPTVSHRRDMFLQITDATNQDPQLPGPAANCERSDGPSQGEEISLRTEDLHIKWNQRGTKNH